MTTRTHTHPRTPLVRAPRTIGADAAIAGVVCRAAPAPLSHAEIRDTLRPLIQRWLRAACLWDTDATVGQFRHLSFSFEPEPEVRVFVRFWSEPFQPVCWQVSSGRTHRPTQRWLGVERWERIRAFGFEVGGDTENFETFVCLSSGRDLKRVAESVVDVLFSALDYQGQLPLMVEAGAGTHRPTQEIYESLTPAQVVDLMATQGQTMTRYDDGDDTATLHFRRRGMATTVQLSERQEGTRSFAALALTCNLEPSAQHVAQLLEATRNLVPADKTPVVRLGTTLQLSGGVTMEWLRQRVSEWNAMTRRYRLEHRKNQPTIAVLPPAASERVH